MEAPEVTEIKANCNNKEYESGYNLLSSDFKKRYISSLSKFKIYVDTVFKSKKIYNIQNYSNINEIYVYSITIMDDILASGSTNGYDSIEDKFVITKENGEFKLALNGYCGSKEINVNSQDKYMEIRIVKKYIKYNKETYLIQFKNMTNNYIVLADNTEKNEINSEPENILPGFESFDSIENKPNISETRNNNQFKTEQFNTIPNNEVKEISTNEEFEYNPNNNLQGLLTGNKKLVSFVGTSKNGTSFLVNNVAQLISVSGVNTAILDTTRNKNSYYIFTQNEEQLRNIAANSIRRLQVGAAEGIKVNNNLTVYTAIPDEDVGINNYSEILKTLLENYDLVLIDCDFNTNFGYFAESQEIYLVQSLDVLTIQPLTAFLRDLKAKNILNPEKIRIVVNKNMKVRGLTDKAIIGGMSFYNEPSMSFMTELFNRDTVRYCSIPFEEQTYSKYLEGLVNCKISLNGYSKIFMQALKELTNMVYTLMGNKPTKNNKRSKDNYTPMNNYQSTNFSQGMNDTLNQMKRNY